MCPQYHYPLRSAQEGRVSTTTSSDTRSVEITSNLTEPYLTLLGIQRSRRPSWWRWRRRRKIRVAFRHLKYRPSTNINGSHNTVADALRVSLCITAACPPSFGIGFTGPARRRNRTSFHPGSFEKINTTSQVLAVRLMEMEIQRVISEPNKLTNTELLKPDNPQLRCLRKALTFRSARLRWVRALRNEIMGSKALIASGSSA